MNHTIDVYTELVENVKNGIRILRGKVGLVGHPKGSCTLGIGRGGLSVIRPLYFRSGKE